MITGNKSSLKTVYSKFLFIVLLLASLTYGLIKVIKWIDKPSVAEYKQHYNKIGY